MDLEKLRKIGKQVKLDLTSVNGNAFSLMGHWQKQARKEGWTKEEIDIVLQECQSGDYNNLVSTLMEFSKYA